MSRYERGRIRRPRAPLPELFAALYRVPMEELFPRRKPAVAAWARPAQQHGGLRVMVGGELVEVAVPAADQPVGRPVVRVGNRPVDPSAVPLLDSTVAAVVASARALLAVMVEAAPGELGGQTRTD